MQDYEEVTDPKILAQLNAPAPAPNMNDYEEVTDPKILAQLNAPNVPQGTSDNSSLAGDIGRHALAGLATFGRDILNVPHNIVNIIPAVYPNYDYYKALGANQNIADKLGVGVLEYTPFGMGAEAALGKGAAALSESAPAISRMLGTQTAANIGGGAAYGAANAQDNHNIGGAIIGAGTGLGSSLIGGAGNIALNYLGKKYAQSAIPAFTKAATDKIKSLLPTSDYASQLFGKFQDAFSTNKGNWDAVKDSANNIDSASQGTFNNQPYHDYIDNYISNVKNMDPAQQAQYAQSAQLAQKAKEIAPQSFTGIVSARQNLNSVLSDYLDPTGLTKPDMYSKQFITGLKNNLKNETLEANSGNVPQEAFNDFKSKWQDANQSHQDLQDFYQSMQGTTGIVKNMTPTQEMYKSALETGTLDPSILNRYTPPLTLKGSQGIEGINQLGKLFGNRPGASPEIQQSAQQQAQDAVQASLFRRPVEQGASTIDSAKIYSDMSPAQRQAVFGNSPQGQMLDAINNTRLAFGREPEKTLAKIGHGLMSVGVPGAIGFGAGMASGEGWDKSLLLGGAAALGSRGLSSLVGRTATPASVARAIQLGKSSPLTGRYLNPFMQMLNPVTGAQQ